MNTNYVGTSQMIDVAVVITPEIAAEAKNSPNGWVYKVDWKYPPDQYTPPEAIVGAFDVDRREF